MFDKVLVANRGEVARRIIATLRRMGIASVAVFTDADVGSLHVADADEAMRIGAGPVADSYLCADQILDAARATGAQAVHPGYGFLSEDAAFATACVDAGLIWIGPSPDHLRLFGDKHSARRLAAACDVPLLAGSGLLTSADAARAEADAIGYPVMLKATAGGGGIGMQRCATPGELADAFDAVRRLADAHFGSGGVYLERYVAAARHVEVQIFGAATEVRCLGLRDCSAQRRHQKVIEETPPFGLDDGLVRSLEEWAVRLGTRVGYRSAGTVEFLVDGDRGDAAFLEVNTRLQVEHGVTELVTGIDVVEWMLREAAGAPLPRSGSPRGAAIEVRVYAEDPAHNDRPGVGTLVGVSWPAGARVDTWVTTGTEVTPWYDPLLAKLIVRGDTREDAVAALGAALADTRLDGVATNLAFLRDAVANAAFRAGGYGTDLLASVTHRPRAVEVVAPGMQTTVQDWPGRLGLWAVGVPPSGPMDDRAFRRANALVGNPVGTPALEITLTGPSLRFATAARVALAGAEMDVALDDRPVPWDAAIDVPEGGVLRVGSVRDGGVRAYLAVAGGFDVPRYLGSAATFMLGRFGGNAGRALAAGDVLPLVASSSPPSSVPPDPAPTLGHEWELVVADGPHGAPDFITPGGIEALYAATWEVHHHSDRTGVRLIGPTPQWARTDGGEAGLHPSNIHDTVYTVGSVDLTGDMPVILGPDGPSLGGFVCPLTVVSSDLWKLGQLAAGDRVRFVRVPPSAPVARGDGLRPDRGSADGRSADGVSPEGPVLRRDGDVTYRRQGDCHVLVELGPNVLDLALRLRAHALMVAVASAAIPGVEELSPGIRSVQVRYRPAVIGAEELIDALAGITPDADTVVPSRIVHLPLSWDDPATHTAIERYMQLVRDDAPWCPSNIEFIRRINGLDSIEDVRDIVFDASYVVLGLGDVYLGAPVATPLDPRHRLVTTKYNPARTWTAENSVGIGGAYLCVYGMEGPGGYQFVGRTIQMWNPHRETSDFPGHTRWLLRFFDQLRFHPVSAEELLDLRRDFPVGRYSPRIEETSLSLAAYQAFEQAHAESIAAAKARQQAAFDAERLRWEAAGEFTRAPAAAAPPVGSAPVPDGALGISTPVPGVVARTAPTGRVRAGDMVVVVEAMKTETVVPSPVTGTVIDVRCGPGDVVAPGVPLAVVMPA